MKLSKEGMGAARLSSNGTTLVPLGPEHVSALRSLEISGDLAFRWRLGGLHPDPSAYPPSLWDDVLCTFLVFPDHPNEPPRGLVCAYEPDFRNGHCRLAAARFGGSSSLHVIRGFCLLLDYVFTGWPFRKVYLEVPEYNLAQFSSVVGRVFVEEGRLSAYRYFNGEYWDLVFLALTRDGWSDVRRRYARFIDRGQ